MNWILLSISYLSLVQWACSKNLKQKFKLEECSVVSTTMIVFDYLPNFMSSCVFNMNIRIFFLKIYDSPLLLGIHFECYKNLKRHEILHRGENDLCCWYMASLFKDADFFCTNWIRLKIQNLSTTRSGR